MVDELPEVRLGCRDVRVAPASGPHGSAELYEGIARPAPFGQQIVGIVLKTREQKAEVLGVDRLGRHGERKRAPCTELGHGFTSVLELLEGQDPP